MQGKRFCVVAVAFVIAIGVLVPPSLAGKPGRDNDRITLEYDIHQLNSVDGTYSGFAADINEVGAVVGQAVDTFTGDVFAACWEVTVASDGTVTSNLSLLPGSMGDQATGVNNFGEVVGNDPFFGGVGPGLYWPSVTDQPLPLLPLTGDTDALPHSINDAGIICGMSVYYEVIEDHPNIQEEHPVVWRVTSDNNGNPVVVGPFALPSTNGIAWDLSEPDADGTVTVAGNAWDDESSAGVTWRVQPQSDGGILIDPQPTILQVGVNVRGINNAGVVCGDSSRPDWIAMLWAETDQIPLALPRKFASSAANDLNDSGVVVGWVGEEGAGFPREPAVWAGPDAKAVLLSSFLSRKSSFDGLTDAPEINELGVIAGAGWADGVQQAFVALPK